MAFENDKFERALATSMASLGRLKTTIDGMSKVKGLENLETSSSKVRFQGLQNAIANVKSKLSFPEVPRIFSGISAAADRVNLTGLQNAFGRIRGVFNFGNAPQKAFAGIDRASESVSLPGITKAVASASSQFSVLQGAAAVALGNIATQAASQGARIAKSLSLNSAIGGFKEYETNMNSIQTILANTDGQKNSGLTNVNKALNELNHYADKTIYNFSEMARNIGTFTAAGVDLDTSVGAIKGIANLAALSGSNSQQASTAMYQLSQAISAGRVGLQDWNSVVNAGMGGAVFQKALAKTAVAMGELDGNAVKAVGPMKTLQINGNSFRNSIANIPGAPPPWLTSDVLTNTLKNLSGDVDDATIAAQGFDAAGVKAVKQQATMAVHAATEVKTLSGLLDTTKEAIGSGWAQTWQTVFGDFGEAKTLFTGLSNTIGGFVQGQSKARNALLDTWKELGGRDKLIEGIKNAFAGLVSVVRPIKTAFRDIFPATTGKQLYDLTVRFANFAEQLKIGPETAKNLQRTFAGLFAVLDIGKQFVQGIFSAISDLLGVVSNGSGGFLDFTGSIGDFLVSLDEAIRKAGGFTALFESLPSLLVSPIELLGRLSRLISGLFDGATDSHGFEGLVENVSGALGRFSPILDAVRTGVEALKTGFAQLRGVFGPIITQVVDQLEGFVDVVGNALANADYDKVFQVIEASLIGGLVIVLKRFFSGEGFGFNFDIGNGILGNLSSTLKVLGGNLVAIQRNIQAKTLLAIAAALGLLAAATLALSLIDPKRLASSMTAIATGLGLLVGALGLLSKVGGATGFLTLPIIAVGMIELAIAVDILALAVAAFSRMSWEDLGKGLLGVAGALAAVGVSVGLIPKSIVLVGPALLPIAAALIVMATAMKIFATLSWEDMAKGLVGVGGGLLAISLGVAAIPRVGLLAMGPGLIALGVGLNILALAIASFGHMDLATLGTGIGGIAASLIVLGIALSAMPLTIGIQGLGLIAMGAGLTALAVGVAAFGSLKLETLAKGLGAIAISLVVLAGGLTLMAGTLPGAAALVAAATGLAILAPALGLIGNLSLETLAKGLGAIAATMVLLGVGGTLAGPGLVAIGTGLLVMGAGILLVGSGLYLIGKAITLVADDGAKGIGVMIAAITALVALLPKIIIDFVGGLVNIAKAIAVVAPQVAEAFGKILITFIDLIIEITPKIGQGIEAIITTVLQVLVDKVPDILRAGLFLFSQLLVALNQNIEPLVAMGSTVVVSFLGALTAQTPLLLAAGANLLITYMSGIATQAPRLVTTAVSLILTFVGAIVANMYRLVGAGVTLVVSFLAGIDQNVDRIIDAGGRLIRHILTGIGNQAEKITETGTQVVGDFLDAAATAMLNLTNKIGRVIVNFLNGIEKAIRTYQPQIIQAGFGIADAIVDGMVVGFRQLGGKAVDGIKGIVTALPNAAKKLLGIHSPSRVFRDIGVNTMLGLTSGLEGSGAISSVESTSEKLAKTMSQVPGLLDGWQDMNPTITPVLDLSRVQKDAKQLSSLTDTVPLKTEGSYGLASATAQERAQTMSDISAQQTPTKEVKFEQKITSPKALSETEVYRHTKNLLSQARTLLGEDEPTDR